MPHELKIPAVGESITQVQISEWLKAEGDVVKRDESVAVIDSEKTTFELPSPVGGRIARILHAAGDTVGIGEVIAQIDPDGTSAESVRGGAAAAREPKEEAKPATAPRPSVSTEKPSEAGTRGTSEPASRADEKRSSADDKSEEPEPEAVDQGQREPVKREIPSPSRPEGFEAPRRKKPEAPTARRPGPTPIPAAREEEVIPMTLLRRTVARRLVEARQTMAMLTTFSEVDMSAIQALRKQHQEPFVKRYEVKLGLMSFFVKAAIDALKRFPQLNAEIRGDDVVYRNYFDIGVAIATERGLVVPVLRNAESLSFAETELAIEDFARRAREGRLRHEDLEGGTFTITNGGVFGSLLSTPIINPPQSGILGMHSIQERPMAIEGQVAIRPMMYLALTYDHRIVDGREAVLFLRRIKEVIESVARMLIEI